MKAVIYARYSSHNQREESIEGQLRECYEYADKNSLQVIGEYIDRAISAKTDKRPDFQKLIRDSERKKFEVVICYTLDRFARNRYDSAIYKARLKKNGVRVVYAKQPMPDSPEGIILESVLEGYAEYYSENLARGTKRGLKENALNGVSVGSAGLMLGYQISPDKKYVIEPVGANTVRTIFNMYLNNCTTANIVRYLNDNNYKTRNGGKFNYNGVHRILRNRKYIGECKYGDMLLEDYPSIIDKNTFDLVQGKMDSTSKMRAKNKAKDFYLLTGKIFCGICGSPMVGESGTSKTGKLYHYYKCTNRKRKRNCTKHIDSKESLESAIVSFVTTKILTDENIEIIAEDTLKLLKKELADNSVLLGLQDSQRDVAKRIKNISDAIEMGIFTATTKARLEALEKEQSDIELKIAKEKLNKPMPDKAWIINLLESFRNGDTHDIGFQRKIIDMFVNSIYVYDMNDDNRKFLINFNLAGNPTIELKSSDITSSGSLDVQYPNFYFYASCCFGCCFIARL